MMLSFMAIEMSFFQLIFLIFAPNMACCCLLEPPQTGGSNGYIQSKIRKLNNIPLNPAFPFINGRNTGVSSHGLVNLMFVDAL